MLFRSYLQNGASRNEIGAPTNGNIIAYRSATNAVIQVDGSSSLRNLIAGNSTFCNAGRGIDLTNNGNNDFGTGILSINRAASDASSILVKIPANTDFVDLYIAGTCNGICTADATGVTDSGLSQGQTYIRRVNLAPSTTVTDITINAQAAENFETVILTATDQNGNTSEFSTCEFDPLCTDPENVSISAPNGNAFCSGDDITITATTSTSGMSFGWIRNGEVIQGANANTITVSDPGTYQVVVWDAVDSALCEERRDTTITQNNRPLVAGITGPDEVCFNTTDVYNYSTTANSDYAYTWSANGATLSGNGTNTISISQFTQQPTTTITVNVVDNSTSLGCDTTVTYDVSVIDLPVVTGIQGNDTLQCAAQGEVYSVTNPEAGTTYSWTVPQGATIVGTNGADSSSITVNFSTFQGNITVIATNSNGCEGVDAATLPIRLVGCGLVANFTSSGIGCINNEITYTDISTSDSPIVSWTWDFGDGASPATATGKGPHVVTYSTVGSKDVTLTIVDADGGTTSTTRTSIVTIYENPAQPQISGITPVCEGTSADYEVTSPLIGSSYNWSANNGSVISDQNGGPIATATFGNQNTTISVIETDSNQCVSPQGSFDVEILPLLGVVSDITAPELICDSRGQFDNYTFSVTAANATVFDWEFITPDSATLVDTYGALFVNGNGTINGNTSNLVMDFGSYSGDIQLQVSVSPHANCGSEAVIKSITFKVNESAIVSYEINNPNVCEGNRQLYTATLTSNIALEPDSMAVYTWVRNLSSDNDTIQIDTINEVTLSNILLDETLYVKVDPDYCYDKNDSDLDDEIELNVFMAHNPLLAIQGDIGFHEIKNVFDANKLQITLTDENEWLDLVNSPIYSWYLDLGDTLVSGDEYGFGSGVSTFTPRYDINAINNTAAKYTLQYVLITDYRNPDISCPDTSRATLSIELDIFIPTVFTPNSDGSFDTWEIENGLQYGPLDVQIFNRWGNLVYEDSNYQNNWLGTNNSGDELPFGTYFYIVKTSNENFPVFRGAVSIMK